jgi:predicted nucleotidyltransferase
MSLHETKVRLQELMPILRDVYKVETVEIFGSYATNRQTPKSDIDLLVTFSDAPDIVGLSSLKKFLRKNLGVKVDIVSKKYLNPLIKDQVLKEAIPI